MLQGREPGITLKLLQGSIPLFVYKAPLRLAAAMRILIQIRGLFHIHPKIHNLLTKDPPIFGDAIEAGI